MAKTSASNMHDLEQRLSELSEEFDRGREITAKRLKIWRDALVGKTDWNDVLNVLTDWPTNYTHFPTPKEIVRMCNSRLSDRVEAQAADNLRNTLTLTDVLSTLETSPNARAFKRMFAEYKRGAVSDPREWCERIEADDTADPEDKAYAAQSLAIMRSDPALSKPDGSRLKRIEHQRGNDPKGWAKNLQERHAAGETLNQAQIDTYTAALR